MNKTNLFLIVITLMFYSCASSEETTQTQQIPKKEPEVYVFDEAGKADSAKVIKPKEMIKDTVKTINEEKIEPTKPVFESKKFIVQVGAFTSRERAQIFVNENQSKIEPLMNISLREQDKLWLVQLPPYNTREDAEKIRNNIWQIPAFKGAFIITTDK